MRPPFPRSSATRIGHGVVAAQVRAAAGLVAAFDPPVLGRSVRFFRGAAHVEETRIGGVPATIYRPGRSQGPWPAFVVFPGVTRLGRRHRAFVGLGHGLATTGHLTIVAEPTGLIGGELTRTAVLQARTVVDATAERPDAARGRVALAGVSGGGTLALLSAAHPSLADRVSALVALAPVCDIVEAIRVVTSNAYWKGDEFVPFVSGDFFSLVVARSVVACLPAGPSRETLLAHLRSLADYGPDPLGALRNWPREKLDPSARAVLELFGNDEPQRFDELFAALPEKVRAAVQSLSALPGASRIEAPVELVVARSDKYIPLADADSFASACPTARLTILASLDHAVPRLSLLEARDLARLDGVLVRVLAASYSRR